MPKRTQVRLKSKVETLPFDIPKGQSRSLYIPQEIAGLNAVVKVVVSATLRIRRAKHADHRTVQFIQDEMFPTLTIEQITQIAFYKILVTIEIQQKVIGIITDLYALGSEMILDLGDRLGVKLSEREKGHIRRLESVYRENSPSGE